MHTYICIYIPMCIYIYIYVHTHITKYVNNGHLAQADEKIDWLDVLAAPLYARLYRQPDSACYLLALRGIIAQTYVETFLRLSYELAPLSHSTVRIAVSFL